MKRIKIFIMYIAWNITFWMDTHIPYLPHRLRAYIFNKFPQSRFSMDWNTYNRWRKMEPTKDFSSFRPLPWPICHAAFGPFVGPWNSIAGLFRRIRGNHSHRCDFTDPINGLLHGGDGETMNRLWDLFMEKIDSDYDDL